MKIFTSLSVVLLGFLSAQAEEALVADRSTFESAVVPFMEKHCYSCHGPEKQKGDFRLDDLPVDFGDTSSLSHWIEVMDNINLGDMPPEDEPVPTIEEISAVAGWIAAEVENAEKAARSTGGRVMIRRLNRTEYANTVRDLLHVDFLPGEGPADLLPPDGALDGFDKVSKALLLDPSLMSQYFDVAALVADKAVVTGPPPVPTRTNRMEYEDTTGGIEYIKEGRDTIVTEDGIITMNSGMRSDDNLKHPWNGKLIPIRGTYRLRLRVGADSGDRGEPLYIRISRSGDGDIWAGKVTGTLEEPQIIEVTRAFDAPGSDEIGVKFENPDSIQRVNYFYGDTRRRADEAIKEGRATEGGRIRARNFAEGMIGQSRPEPASIDMSGYARLFFDWIELEGPIYDQWPPQSTEALFSEEEVNLDGSAAEEKAKALFAELLPRAFRRPVEQPEIDRVVGVVNAERAAGEPFPEAIKAGIIATLCSPSFLLLFEDSIDAEDDLRPLDDHEIATRLSYFLWSSMPDRELFDLAKTGTLSDPSVRLAQVERMLADKKSSALVEGFATQWLKANEYDRFSIDRQLYRDFYEVENVGLNEAMNREPLAFFEEILRNDLSVLHFLDSDWTMANETLARWYGIPGVSGTEFQRVALPEELNRGGIISMAAIHKWGSDGNRTKPIERGKYVLDVLFNDPAPPPPPNVSEVEPNVEGENLTVRERLEQHRQIESCRACHARIDPYGLAMENFNVVGKWRTKQDGERGWWPDEAVIDASGTFPNGRPFADIDEFRNGLTAQSDRFLRGLAEKMLVYSLGRGIEGTDRGLIDDLVEKMKSNKHTIRSLIQGIVESETFVRK